MLKEALKSFKMKTFALVTVLLVAVLSAGSALAQTSPEDIAAAYGVTFPIAELGDCQNYNDCRDFCEDPVNHSACIEFAKKKGFYDKKIPGAVEALLAAASEKLGCSTYQECANFCAQPGNFDACNDFAQTHKLTGGYEGDPTEEGILTIAQEVLGCDSYESCAVFCSDPANFSACSDFANQVGLLGGEHDTGPGGCSSEASCRDFCSDPNNYDLCSGYADSTGGSFSGPGGCDSEASCRAYCEDNHGECRYFGSEVVDPDVFCNEFPEKCAQFDGPVTPGDFEKYCLENPNECTVKANYDPELQCNNTPKCAWTGTNCECYEEFYGGAEGTYDPATECTNYGCTWTGDICQCGETFVGQPPAEDPAAQCSSYGCTWTGTTCECLSSGGDSGGSGGSDPATECANYGCNWTGSSCECPSSYSESGYSSYSESSYGTYPEPSPGVYGAEAVAGWLEGIWYSLLGLFAR